MRRILVLCLLYVPMAEAATLRPATSLTNGFVRLSDLFDDAGDNAARILGPGPAPGGRIVVEAAQLAAIARQFGVSWQPASRAERIVLERPGRPLARETVLDVLRAALRSAGMAEESEIELNTASFPLVPFDADIRPAVTRLEHDTASGAFSATMIVGSPGMETIHLRLTGRVHETLSVLVPVRRVQPAEVLRPDELRPLRVRAASLNAEVARQAEDVAGLIPRVALAPNQPIRLADLIRPPAVRKGASVQMALQGGGLALMAQAVALESAAPGERVRVMNPSSRAVLEAMVVGPDRVQVSPDSLPLQLPAGGTLPLVAR